MSATRDQIIFSLLQQDDQKDQIIFELKQKIAILEKTLTDTKPAK